MRASGKIEKAMETVNYLAVKYQNRDADEALGLMAEAMDEIDAVDRFLDAYEGFLKVGDKDAALSPYEALEYGVTMNGYELTTACVESLALGNYDEARKNVRRLADCLEKYLEDEGKEKK